MKLITTHTRITLSFLLMMIAALACTKRAYAQPSVLTPPVFTENCYKEYITDLTSSAPGGGTANIFVTGGTCGSGSNYFDYHTTKGLLLTEGYPGVITVTRASSPYTAWVVVYADWNNSGYYDEAERVGKPVKMDSFVTLISYSIPVYCMFTGTRRMRLVLTDSLNAAGAPGIVSWGQAYDFWVASQCPTTPAPISGNKFICYGERTILNNGAQCGTWTSSNTSVASVDFPFLGQISSINTGTSTISYTSAGCGYTLTTVVTVSALVAITGPGELCLTTATYSATPTGGTWSSSNPAVVNISSTGVAVRGIMGTATISYTSTFGCVATKTVWVNDVNPTIYGTTTMCRGETSTLSSGHADGVWSSANPSIANFSFLGVGVCVVSGVNGGTTTISYTTPACGTLTTTVTILPIAVTGVPASLCVGDVASLTGSPSGGTWTSFNPALVSVNSTGVVTAVAPAGGAITYTAPNGCSRPAYIPVYGIYPITGSTAVCAGSATHLFTEYIGGTWASSNPAVTVGFSGFYLGLERATVSASLTATGTVTITNTSDNGCVSSWPLTIGTASVRTTTTLQACSQVTLPPPYIPGLSSGGGWGSTSINSVNSSGVVTSSVSTGTDMITYTPTNSLEGCPVFYPITVTPFPSIVGSSLVCKSGSSSFSIAHTGGAWSSSNSAVATVNSGGVVTGVDAGIVTISYSSLGCVATKIVTVESVVISGATSVCTSATITASIPGGSWSTSDPSLATIAGSSGTATVNSVSYGTFSAVYAAPSGCITTYPMTSLKPTLTTNDNYCVSGSGYTLGASPAGLWTSTNPSLFSISGSSVTIGNTSSVSSVILFYNTGSCIATKTVTIHPRPKLTTYTGITYIPFADVFGAVVDLNYSPITYLSSIWSSGSFIPTPAIGTVFWLTANLAGDVRVGPSHPGSGSFHYQVMLEGHTCISNSISVSVF